MHRTLTNICTALENTAKLTKDSWGDDRTLQEVFGWNCPAVTRHDLAALLENLSTQIKQTNIETLDTITEKRISNIPEKLKQLHNTTIPHLYNGHANQAAPAFIETFKVIDSLLQPIYSWEKIHNNKILPSSLARKLNSIKAQLEQLTPNKDELTERINLINDATDAAESLPEDMQKLGKAKEKIEDILKACSQIENRLQNQQKYSTDLISSIKTYDTEAKKLVSNCEEAYRITTTKGLAASFDQRAASLGKSMWVWVVGLIISLITGGILGSLKIKDLSDSLANNNHPIEIIGIQLILSFLSIGAPLWFALLSSKQISQRFRLAEDYAFKSSVAKAYEGYRKEAVNLDKSFASRLFGAALTRLEEEPLRLISKNDPQTPINELLNSPPIKSLIESVPGLKDKLIEAAESGLRHMTQDRRRKLAKTDQDNG